MSSFPQHQGTLSFGVITKYAPESSTSSRRWWYIYARVFMYIGVFVDSLRLIYPEVHFSRRHSTALEIRGRTFSDKKKKENMSKIKAKNRVRDVAGCFEFCQTHPHDSKEHGVGKSFPSHIHFPYLVQNFKVTGTSTMIDFRLNLGRFFVMRFGWPSATHLISVWRTRLFCRLYPVPLALVITTEVVLVFKWAWFFSGMPKAKGTNYLARTIVQ